MVVQPADPIKIDDEVISSVSDLPMLDLNTDKEYLDMRLKARQKLATQLS